MQSLVHVMPPVALPAFTGLQLYMHKATGRTLEEHAPAQYVDTIATMLRDANIDQDLAFWITIDERYLVPGEQHRRGGVHIDGNYIFSWGGGGSSGWLNGTPGRVLTPEQHRLQYQSTTGGTLLVSNYHASVAWIGEVEGIAGQGGCCAHLREQFEQLPRIDLSGNNHVMLMNSTCIHDSLPVREPVDRQLLRITLHDSYVFPTQVA